MQIIDPTVNVEFLSAAPGILNDRSITDVHDLLDDIEFAQTIPPLL